MLNTGDLKCWGFGERGRLGYGNADDIGDDETPAMVGAVDVTDDPPTAVNDAFTVAEDAAATSLRSWPTTVTPTRVRGRSSPRAIPTGPRDLLRWAGPHLQA